jgi:hypothetical protein
MSSDAVFQRHQLRSFHLAGTVALPSPYPEVGYLFLVSGGLHYQSAKSKLPSLDLVAIEHCQSNRVTITRYVALHDVMAVLLSGCPNPDSDRDWYFGPEIAPQLEARSTVDASHLCVGIAYVREQAPILMKVEVGLTAAESAEYYPPVVGERSDVHYHFANPAAPKDCSHDSGPRDCRGLRECRGI